MYTIRLWKDEQLLGEFIKDGIKTYVELVEEILKRL